MVTWGRARCLARPFRRRLDRRNARRRFVRQAAAVRRNRARAAPGPAGEPPSHGKSKLPELDTRAFATVGDGCCWRSARSTSRTASRSTWPSNRASCHFVRSTRRFRICASRLRGVSFSMSGPISPCGARLRFGPRRWSFTAWALPAATVAATFEPSRVDATVAIDDPSLAAHGKRVRPVRRRARHRLRHPGRDAASIASALARLARQGAGALHLRGTFARGELDAHFDGRVSQVCRGAVCVMSADVGGSLRGPWPVRSSAPQSTPKTCTRAPSRSSA